MLKLSKVTKPRIFLKPEATRFIPKIRLLPQVISHELNQFFGGTCLPRAGESWPACRWPRSPLQCWIWPCGQWEPAPCDQCLVGKSRASPQKVATKATTNGPPVQDPVHKTKIHQVCIYCLEDSLIPPIYSSLEMYIDECGPFFRDLGSPDLRVKSW